MLFVIHLTQAALTSFLPLYTQQASSREAIADKELSSIGANPETLGRQPCTSIAPPMMLSLSDLG